MEAKKKSPSPIAWALGQAGPHRGQFVLSVVLAVLGVAFSVAPYFAVAGIVKGLMAGEKNLTYYLTQAGIIALLWLGRVLCHAFSTATSHRATFAVLGEIRKRCTEKLTRMPLGAVLAQSSGALKNTLIERIDSIETTLAHIVPEFTANLLIPVIITVYIFTVDWRMGLASLATVPLGIFFYIWMMATSSGFYQATINNTKALNNTAVEYINGIQVIKVFGKTKSSYERFVKDAHAAAGAFIGWMRASIIPFTFAMVVMPATMVSVLPIGGLLEKGGTLSGQDFVTVIILSVGLITPLITLMSYSDDIRTMGTIFGEVQAILDAPREDVIAAVKKACCHDFITALPDGYDTVIGEGGANLSGGERQRISIARAMMKDAPVIFLDEATANVDPENAAAIILWFALMMTGSARRIEVKRIGSLRFSGLPLITLRLNTSRLGRDAYQLALQRGRTAATQLDQL